jgi:hypothetical protein
MPPVAIASKRNCKNRDEGVYLTFWAVTSFSLFIASDKIVAYDEYSIESSTRGVLYGVTILQSTTHQFALNCIIITSTELYRALTTTGEFMCIRPLRTELHMTVAGLALYALTLLDAIAKGVEDDGTRADRQVLLLCSLLPWIAATIALGFGLREVFRRTTTAASEPHAAHRPGRAETVKVLTKP